MAHFMVLCDGEENIVLYHSGLATGLGVVKKNKPNVHSFVTNCQKFFLLPNSLFRANLVISGINSVICLLAFNGS